MIFRYEKHKGDAELSQPPDDDAGLSQDEDGSDKDQRAASAGSGDEDHAEAARNLREEV